MMVLRYTHLARVTGAVALCLALAACSSNPPAPSWQSSAKGASDRAVQAYFEGDKRVEEAEFARAREELARTGDATQIAKLELLRCAAQVASLVIGPCAAFQPLARDATASERAYARYLEGKAVPADFPLLPQSQRVAASASPAQAAEVLDASDPLASLVAAGVIFARGGASPALVNHAIDTASHQGWSRPLLAWLGVQLKLAEEAGRKDEAARVQRRMDLVAPPSMPPAK